jgi:tetratricopeptide (TPR) repeat protein
MEGGQKLVGQGYQLLSQGEYKKALSKFDKAIKEDPENAEAYFGKAEAGMLVPKVTSEDILAAYNKAIELDPENAYYYSSLGAFCIDEGRFNDAEQAYNKAAELDSDNSSNYYSEFAVSYYQRAPEVHEQFMDETGLRIIRKKALQYMLKSLGMEEDEARNLLS